MNLSFAGCGFMGVYHLGVASCFSTYAPHVLGNKITGASSGSVVAALLVGGCDLGSLASNVLEGCYSTRNSFFGIFHRSPNYDPSTMLREGMEKSLPEDVHLKASGRLHVSLTRVKDGKNVVVSQYDTKEEVIQAIVASCWHPGASGLIPPKYRGSTVIDGAYSHNIPLLDEDTITVSPFAGCADICPQTDDFGYTLLLNWYPNYQPAHCSVFWTLDNGKRMFRVLRPPPPELAARYCKQGFEDTLRFLQSRYLISCTRCLGEASSYQTEEELPLSAVSCVEFDPKCGDCVQQRREANADNLPLCVLEEFDLYKKVEKSSSQKIQENQLVRTISYPSVIMAHGLLWILTHLLPQISSYFGKLVLLVLIVVFSNQFAQKSALSMLFRQTFTKEPGTSSQLGGEL